MLFCLCCSGANVFFFALALLLLFIFIVWCVLCAEQQTFVDSSWAVQQHVPSAAAPSRGRMPVSMHAHSLQLSCGNQSAQLFEPITFCVCRRLLRWCCVVCCCRGSCDLKRSQHDPGEILFGKRMKINKVPMPLPAQQTHRRNLHASCVLRRWCLTLTEVALASCACLLCQRTCRTFSPRV
jgi:hypothetical protein